MFYDLHSEEPTETFRTFRIRRGGDLTDPREPTEPGKGAGYHAAEKAMNEKPDVCTWCVKVAFWSPSCLQCCQVVWERLQNFYCFKSSKRQLKRPERILQDPNLHQTFIRPFMKDSHLRTHSHIRFPLTCSSSKALESLWDHSEIIGRLPWASLWDRGLQHSATSVSPLRVNYNVNYNVKIAEIA